MITRDMLEAFAPRPKGARLAEIWSSYIDAILDAQAAGLFEQHHIDSCERFAHLMAQWGHECNGFTLLWESGAYSAKRISAIFGVGRHSARITEAEARRIAALPPEARGPVLFDRAYGIGNPRKARELGNIEAGDGWRYRGFGIQQITGRRDHERLIAGDYTALGAVRAALQEWTEKGCNEEADDDNIYRVTKLINGGQNGIEDRKRWLARARRAFGDEWPRQAAEMPHEAAHEPADPSGPAPQETPPAAPATAPAADLERDSKTVGLFASIKRWISRTAIGSGGFSLADWLGSGGKNVGILWGQVVAHPQIVAGIVAALLVGGWVVAWWTIERRKLELAEGRYVPARRV